ncbi:MAG: F0F1 ATP synthase subunit epsilon [Alphaproteobacteria bacterium]|nr:F0F1 ATP synthase subunit epsilon [Alphaproteobacteria bacterium]
MHLKTLMPTGVVVDEEISRIRFEAKDGSRTFLPRHVDFVTAIAQGIVSYNPLKNGIEQEEVFMACDEGILVKQADMVYLSVRRAVMNNSLEVLVKTIGEEFKKAEEERKISQTALARLEVNLTQGIMHLKSKR